MAQSLIEVILIIALGIGAQWLSWRLRLPAILLLIMTGIVVGPIMGILRPQLLFGHLFFPAVSVSVAIILYEGGLSLKFSELKKIQSVVWRLTTFTVFLTWTMIALAAVFFLGFSLNWALLLGAILVVTGPTVIGPLIRSLRLSNRIGSILKWEAMLNDPIGAVLAILVYEAITMGGFHQAASLTILGIIKTILFGSLLGSVGAWLLTISLKRYWIPDYLQSAISLMLALVVFGISNMIQHESGLLAVTLMGLLLANQRTIDVGHIISFKENLRVLLISSLFIVLAAHLELSVIFPIGWREVLFILFIIFFVRPVAILLSTWRVGISGREKTFLAFMAPRGIVAAAVSSVLALELVSAGAYGAERIAGLTFLVVIVTVIFYGLIAPFLARYLGIASPNPQGVIILGAHKWARKIGVAIKQEGFPVLLVDSNPGNVLSAHQDGLNAYCGDFLSDQIIDQLNLDGIGHLLALTPNDSTNSLAALHFLDFFGRSEIFRLPVMQKPGAGDHNLSSRTYGRVLFKSEATYTKLNKLFLEQGSVEKVQVLDSFSLDDFENTYGKEALILFVIENKTTLKIVTADRAPHIHSNSELLILRSKK
ncbi:MAG: hypothetical protein COV74_09250 [Candidatus Omnitrophica bacterium CG11_big_fil_rev_8_21_14_0_20_45_26]|uniref:Uncharacterized protein n=1 Tax=Candidatus Abzuiibacterium crystallinum TaxID=1974748 RepID=A0A2H0LPE1_9BACT|nr:MAG: hypothetical protein COV74_09250 [Candidatus Omnitrophica bacterium CG11_big_fil_rev_8_21_14_0_20_45_26]PIW63257.1 MAG: hypothetical protein COW12_11225 [Candidatus Omnitrophica bacterium CG12_big_fil_rev_8_21_14_0_65_45_16]